MTVSATLVGVLLKGVAASRPAANAVAGGTVYSATDTGAITQSDGTSWSTFATISTGLADPMTTRGDMIVRNASNVTARLGRGSASQVLTSDGTDVAWAAPSGGGSDLLQAASGAGNFRIPGLAGSPDVPAGGGSDDEFDTTDTSDPMTGWTTLGSLAALDMNSTAKSHLYMKSTQSTFRIDGVYKACPSIPFTVTAKLADILHGANYQTAGIFVAEAAPGKILTLDLLWINSIVQLERLLFTNPTTYGSVQVTLTIGGTAVPMPIYLRLVVASSTDITPQFSFGGRFWRNVTASYNPSFTVGAVGLFVNSEGGGVNDARALFDWIRFT